MAEQVKKPAKEPEPKAEPEAPPATGAPGDAPPAAETTEPPADILPASHWTQAPLPEDPDDDEADSTLGGDAASSTASLSASILEYRTIHGRTFHRQIGVAEAWEPNDERHSESLDMHHHACTLALGDKLFLAPLKDNIQTAVDIGTGTGIWAIDFADQFPSAQVIGTDLSPIQPSMVPPNLRFEIDDANLAWTWKDNTFDYVHLRAMFGSIADWQSLYREAFRTLKPGGWIEDYENSVKMESDDGSVVEGSPMNEWAKVFWEGGKKFKRTFRVLEDNLQKKYMEEAGFVDVQVWDFKCPIGGWPKDPRLKLVGLFSKQVLESDIEGYVLYMWNAVMGWKPEEIQVYIAHLRHQLRDPKVHSYYRHRVVYGRKPE